MRVTDKLNDIFINLSMKKDLEEYLDDGEKSYPATLHFVVRDGAIIDFRMKSSQLASRYFVEMVDARVAKSTESIYREMQSWMSSYKKLANTVGSRTRPAVMNMVYALRERDRIRAENAHLRRSLRRANRRFGMLVEKVASEGAECSSVRDFLVSDSDRTEEVQSKNRDLRAAMSLLIGECLRPVRLSDGESYIVCLICDWESRSGAQHFNTLRSTDCKVAYAQEVLCGG